MCKDNSVSNIVVFATYWNEIEWIEPSLEQLCTINPKRAIICDGCFDPKYHNGSTDGTREVIDRFCANNPRFIRIEAIRKSKIQHIWDWLKFRNYHVGPMGRIKAKLRGIKQLLTTNIYRINQMATFQHMLTNFSKICSGEWFMTYDCDQFYSDEIISIFRQIGEFGDYDILTCKEYTFFDAFDRYTDQYEKRDYNNMPHKFCHGMRFIPTRHPAVIHNDKYTTFSDVTDQKKYVGLVYHYHIKSSERKEAGYRLGDRKAPNPQRTVTQHFTGIHPSTIMRYFNID
ncbi:glycosyltransferase [Eubacteriales bacterium OttesenSCG-928-M02]|nr:glycosyltransferase [Eubacteriales bacterium OttesenSCG-928-M02]